jgi:hypothetical protein
MTPDELPRQRWQYVQPVGIVRDDAPALYTRGIVGGDAFCVAITVNGNTIHRLDGETWDAFLSRLRNDAVVRGDASNIATCIYSPHVEPKDVKNIQPRFRERFYGG